MSVIYLGVKHASFVVGGVFSHPVKICVRAEPLKVQPSQLQFANPHWDLQNDKFEENPVSKQAIF